ncbi:hypothetical protein B0A67_15725 [Flavobacterium aquidurense]|uniref:hypothetical protein n=1 Tax=Flavobacterium aquidurense TaxID=362413 RepID=UPI000916CBED|nr:hypothetical protein [Flavobacterium aquidurense]OXA70464.1 hypothetical protein B0A67_15725 [Flavobacterium aquidurense]SHH72996.1 hypothetical protein SAMN05444481_12532 [Flavobacterium frigidimaris]
MRIQKIYYFLLFSGLTAAAQDNGARRAGRAITDKFPLTRTFDVQYESMGTSDYDTKVMGEDFEKATVKSHSRLKIATNIPLYKSESQRFFLTNTLRYKYENYHFGEVYNYLSSASTTRADQNYHYLAESVSATYFFSLFRKPIIYNASITVDGNDKNIQRVKGLITATMVLKKTENTTMTIGGVAMLDPSSIIPFTPIFTYEHKFERSPWKIDIILPQRIKMQRQLFENGRLSFGTELNSENFYITFDNQKLNGVYELNQLELKTGIMYEYNFAKNFVATLKGGLNNIITSRITQKGEKTNNYIIENKQDAQLYFNAGLSYNLF